MATTHVLDEEVCYDPDGRPEPTPQTCGLCGYCYGYGTMVAYNDRGKCIGVDTCDVCGGDGTSVLVEGE